MRLPLQLRFELLKYFDTSTIIRVDPRLDTPYFWRQMIADDLIFRNNISFITMNAAAIRDSIITRADLVEALALCNERFDPLALLLLDPVVSAGLIYTQRPEYYPEIKPTIAQFLNDVLGDSSDTTIIYLARFFAVINLEELQQLLSSTIMTRIEGESALSILQVIVDSGNAELFADAFLYYSNSAVYNQLTYSKVLTTVCSLKHRTEMMEFLQDQHLIRPLSILGHVNNYYTDMAMSSIVSDTGGKIMLPSIIIDLILQKQFVYLRTILAKLDASWYYFTVTALIMAGYYEQAILLFDGLGQNDLNPGVVNVILHVMFVSIGINYEETNVTITTAAIPNSWIKWLEQVPATATALFFVAAINGDLSMLQQVMQRNNITTDPVITNNYKQLCMEYWQIFAPNTCVYLVQQFVLAGHLRLGSSTIFPVNEGTVREQLSNIVNIASGIDIKLSQELLQNILNNIPAPHDHVGSLYLNITRYLDQMSTQLIIPDVRHTIIIARTRKLAVENSYYLARAKIFVQLPRELQISYQDSVTAVRKREYYSNIIREQDAAEQQ